MDIACPNCAATYRVPDTLLASGKALRCAACDHEWVAVAVAAVETAPEPSFAPEPNAAPAGPLSPGPGVVGTDADATALVPPRAIPVRSPPPTTPPPLQRRNQAGSRPAAVRPPATRRMNASLPLAWLASVMLVTIVLFALVVFGEEIAAAWPPFERVQALLGG